MTLLKMNYSDDIRHAPLKKLFEVFDVRRTGCIELIEFKAILNALMINTSLEELAALIPKKSSDKYIDYKTFENILLYSLPKIDSEQAYKHVFKLFCAENNNFIDIKSLSNLCYDVGENIQQEELKRMFELCDLNNDGRISCEEFVSLLKQCEL